MKAIERMMNKIDEMLEEINKMQPKDNANIYLKQSLQSIFCALKCKAYEYLVEEIKEEIQKQNNN